MDIDKFKQSLESSEKQARIKNLTNIWDNLQHKKGALVICYPEWEENGYNIDLFFKEMILNESDYNRLTERLDKITKANQSIIEANLKELSLRQWSDFILQRNTQLVSSDWSMLPDVDLNREAKDNYRKYRKYLRKLPGLYKLKVVDQLVVLTYEEFIKSSLANLNIDLIVV